MRFFCLSFFIYSSVWLSISLALNALYHSLSRHYITRSISNSILTLFSTRSVSYSFSTLFSTPSQRSLVHFANIGYAFHTCLTLNDANREQTINNKTLTTENVLKLISMQLKFGLILLAHRLFYVIVIKSNTIPKLCHTLLFSICLVLHWKIHAKKFKHR